ncbi:hypothetical protein BG006_009340 [Podila minutissima]|uniref:Uncharacterized protein n=1 Tax=Podila minutissima TaxID=64525 RepID=A0A9P5SEI6_9FUNG|nr:hypothetical protein BG006_009340 [Podila minutissima]
MTELLWHPIPGRLQSVSVADKAHIWGVTLDLQLARFNTKTQQWQLVSYGYGYEFDDDGVRVGGAGEQNDCGAVAELRDGDLGFLVQFAECGRKVGHRLEADEHEYEAGGGAGGGEEDEDMDSTVKVSAAMDGTVVRLDKTLKAWFLITPQNEEIWGLSDCGDIYYGSSDRFVQLDAAVTSGAGYGQPQFTHISVGLDNTVLATDAHTGTVFRLKKTDPTTQPQSHPPLWTALPGTGPRGLHIANCSLSTSDFIVGVSKDGRSYRFSNGRWTSMGGGAKLNNVGVGADGYVIGVDRDGDLFGFQLEKLLVPARTVPKAIAIDGKGYDFNNNNNNNKQEYEAMEMPKTPTQQKSFSRRPMASPRELFEMAAGDRGNSSEKLSLGGAAAASAAIAAGRSSSYSRFTMVRSESAMSKRSYASDIGSGRTTPTGLNIIQQPSQDPLSQVLEVSSGASTSSGSLEMLSPESPLRVLTKRTGDSYFEPRSDTECLKSPASGFPMDGNPYITTRSLESSQNNTRNSSPASSTRIPEALNSTIGSSSLSNDLTKERSLSKGDHDNKKQEVSDSDDSVDLAKVHRIHALALAKKGGEGQSQNNNHIGTSIQPEDNTKPLTPPPEDQTRSSEQEEGPGEKEEVLSMEPGNTRPELFVVTRFDTEQGINVVTGDGDSHDAQENHNVDTHLHTPPMTTPEEDKRQPFATSSKDIDFLSGGERSFSMASSGEGFGEGRGRSDSLRVEMNLVELVAGEDHPEEYKRRPFRPSIDEGSTQQHPQQQQQPSPQSSGPQPYSIFSSTSFPEKEKEHTDFIPSDPKHFFLQEDPSLYYQAPELSSHRTSGSSEEFMLQQQAFLRQARLRSESFQNNTINNTNNNSNIGKREVFENIKEEAPSSPIPLQLLSPSTSKTEIDTYPEHPLANPGQHQYYQQEQKQEYQPFINTPPPLASTSAPHNINNIDNNMPFDPATTPQITPLITSQPEQQEQLPLEERKRQLYQTEMQLEQQRLQQLHQPNPIPRPQPSVPAYLPPQPGGDKDKDTDEAASRPSYSSSHLQHYVDTTMVYQSGLVSAERRQSQLLLRRNGGGGGGGVGGLTRQGGIQGEDAHGRWIGGSDPSDVRQWNPDDVHKNKCCTIL